VVVTPGGGKSAISGVTSAALVQQLRAGWCFWLARAEQTGLGVTTPRALLSLANVAQLRGGCGSVAGRMWPSCGANIGLAQMECAQFDWGTFSS
jgi:hypothetical protein